jgi:transcriptional regulator NrdR family protein
MELLGLSVCPIADNQKSMLFVLSTTRVTNSRFFKRQNTVWRRRQTPDGVVFTTRETIDLEQVRVINESGEASNFKPGKLYLSLARACDHLPDADSIAWSIKNTIEEKLTALLDERLELTSAQIAQTTIETLRLYNTSAYVKYASGHPKLVSPRKLVEALR